MIQPLTYAAETPLSDAGSNDELHDEFLGALAALGGSAGNGRLRDVLEADAPPAARARPVVPADPQPAASRRPSARSMPACARRLAAAPSSTTPSRPPGCCFSNTSTAWRMTAPPWPRWRAAAPARSWSRPTAGTAGPHRRMPTASWITTPPSPATTCAIS